MVPESTPPSIPVWLELPSTEGLYPVRDPLMAGLPEGPLPLQAELAFGFGDQTLTLRRPLVFKWVDPVLGERYRAVEVLPAVTVDPLSRVALFPDAGPREVKVTVRSTLGAAGTLSLQAPAGFSSTPAEARFELAAAGETTLSFQVTPPKAAQSGALRAVATVAGKQYDRGLRRIEHAHIPIQTWLSS